MNAKPKPLHANPYDLPAVRRSASGVALKTLTPIRQPYSLSATLQTSKTTVLLRAKSSD
jgi:hypothetical protein